MKSFKKSLVLLPLSLLVLSSVAPVAAKADSWGSKERNIINQQDFNTFKSVATDQSMEKYAAQNEANVITYIQNAINSYSSSNNQDNANIIATYNRYINEAKAAEDKYNKKALSVSDKFTNSVDVEQDIQDSEDDMTFLDFNVKIAPNSTAYLDVHSMTNNAIPTNLDVELMENNPYLAINSSDNSSSTSSQPAVVVPATTSTSNTQSNSNDADAKAIASLQAEVAKLEKEVSGQKKSSSHTKALAADKKQLAKINKELHQKHLSKKAHHKLVLQRKALLKAIKKLVK